MLRIILFITLLSPGFYLKAQVLPLDSINPINDSLKKGYVEVKADQRLDIYMKSFYKSNKGKQIAGFRIQLYSGTRQGAFDLKKSFINTVEGTPASVVYESPDFKLQVGNYRTKLEAERAMQEIWPLFKSAFLVKTLIDLPPLPIEKKPI